MDIRKIVTDAVGKAEGMLLPAPTTTLDPDEYTTTLRGDNGTIDDPRLDRIVYFDERSRDFPIRELLAGTSLYPRSKTWGCRVWNDQGQEGACVGFAWSHELAAIPLEILASASTAYRIYKRAQFLDVWAGENYSGTSVLAGAKAVQELKSGGKQIMPEYRWAFGLEDLILAVGHQGPAVIGVNWYTGMFNTGPDRFIRVQGSLAGGHAILVRGFICRWKEGSTTRTFADLDLNQSFFIMRNSWGKDWGYNGDCYITASDMGRLLNEYGEACIPVLRRAA